MFTIGEYKGNVVITLKGDSRFGFTFGLTKAKLILQHIDDIRRFVEENRHKKAGGKE